MMGLKEEAPANFMLLAYETCSGTISPLCRLLESFGFGVMPSLMAHQGLPWSHLLILDMTGFSRLITGMRRMGLIYITN